METVTESMVILIQFAKGSTEVDIEKLSEMRKAADFLNRYPDSAAVIEGHSDDLGAYRHNEIISQKRADAVKLILIKAFDIPAERITAIGYGEERPLSDNISIEGRAKNRRAVITVGHTVKRPVKRNPILQSHTISKSSPSGK